ncbi:GtrA family protein, partial [Bosea sp. TAB14]|uniref:GtrA family protein n=1 Tax=Bosea sp. TAB14 TaxID=3237481 RepID=UPI003F8E7E83
MAWLRARLNLLLASDTLLLKAVRFGIIGAASSLVFAAVTAFFVGLLGVDAKFASIAGYVASVPLNFVGNRRFSFGSQNSLVGDLIRFAVLHTSNILLTTFAMAAA